MDTSGHASLETDEPRVARPGLLALAVATLITCGIRTISHADFWIHLAAGREILKGRLPAHDLFSFAVPDSLPWLNTSWLYDVILAAMWKVGEAPLTILVHVALVAIAFAILLPVARKRAGDTCIAVALILATWMLAPRFEPRPFLFCMPIAAFFIAALSADKSIRILASTLLPAQLLWANLHESFFLGPAIAALFAIEAYLAEERVASARFKELALLTAGLCGIALVNPYGARPWMHVLQSITNPTYNILLEWISPFSWQFSFRFGRYLVTASLVLVAAGFVAYRKRLPVALTTLAVLSALSLVRTARYVDVCALLAFPFFCLSLQSLGDLLLGILRRTGIALDAVRVHASVLFAVLLAATSVGALASNLYYNRSGSASAFGVGVQYELFPEGAVRLALQQAGFPDRALNLAADGGFLAWSLPDRKIFTDTRDTLYGTRFYQDLGKALLGDADLWKRTMEQWRPEAVILNCCWSSSGDAIKRLVASGQWRLVYFDGSTAILVSSVSTHRALIQNEALQAAGLEALEGARRDYQRRLARDRFPPNPPALIGASSVFQSLGRFKEAEAILGLLVQGAPSMTTTWLSLGVCQLQTGRDHDAVESLERATTLLPRNIKAWLWLEKAYAIVGQDANAKVAHEKARELDPRYVDALARAAAPAKDTSPAATTSQEPH